MVNQPRAQSRNRGPTPGPNPCQLRSEFGQCAGPLSAAQVGKCRRLRPSSAECSVGTKKGRSLRSRLAHNSGAVLVRLCAIFDQGWPGVDRMRARVDRMWAGVGRIRSDSDRTWSELPPAFARNRPACATLEANLTSTRSICADVDVCLQLGPRQAVQQGLRNFLSNDRCSGCCCSILCWFGTCARDGPPQASWRAGSVQGAINEGHCIGGQQTRARSQNHGSPKSAAVGVSRAAAGKEKGAPTEQSPQDLCTRCRGAPPQGISKAGAGSALSAEPHRSASPSRSSAPTPRSGPGTRRGRW